MSELGPNARAVLAKARGGIDPTEADRSRIKEGTLGGVAFFRAVMPALAEHYTVLAPDLIGHGESAKPMGDYSLGAFASGLRDLMGVLGLERATVVGQSLGGGVALPHPSADVP